MQIKQAFIAISTSIIDAKNRSHFQTGKIQLLAVSKQQSPEKILSLYKLGQRQFGESYVQEALTKMQLLQACDIEWHFIGAIQSNKACLISHHFNWVQSLSREKIAIKLNENRPLSLPPLNVLIQVNLNEEPTKEGVLLTEVAPLCEKIIKLPRLKLRGLMAIPQKQSNIALQHENFAKLKMLFDTLKLQFHFDTLSMGMSDDYVAAIEEGATMVRIGSQLFGAREKR